MSLLQLQCCDDSQLIDRSCMRMQRDKVAVLLLIIAAAASIFVVASSARRPKRFSTHIFAITSVPSWVSQR